MKGKLDKKIIRKLFVEGLNGAQISRKLGISKGYAYKLLNQLKSDEPMIVNSQFIPMRKNVHAQKIRAFVHYAPDKYWGEPQKYFKEFVEGVDVGCVGKYIYLTAHNKKFSARDETKAYWKSLGFWEKVIRKLEDRLGVVIFKKGAQAFEFLYSEYETRDSPVAKDSLKRGTLWRVYHDEDGKLRLSVDLSDGELNHETHHKRDNHVDSLVFQKHINNLLNNPQAPSFSELGVLIKEIALQNKETAEGLNAVVQVLKSQFPARNEIREGVLPSFYHG